MKIKKAIIFIMTLCLALFGMACKDAPPINNTPVRERLELNGYETLNKDNTAFIDSPFYTDLSDEVTYAFNAMWDIFGECTGGAVDKYSDNSSWLYWDAAKWAWKSGSTRNNVKNILRNYPQRADGYLWSWRNSETWGGAGYNNEDKSYIPVYHYDQMFNYINAVREICVWDGNTSFLSQTDTNTAKTNPVVNGIEYSYEDVSKGKTVWQKTELAMNYILNDMFGKDGLVILGGDNTGDFNSASSNYWDNYSFGYKDSYEGMLFIGALASMADLYKMQGNAEKEAEFRTLWETARKQYDETYWDAGKGRYISCVTKSGKSLDYGLTFLNTEALYYGAGDKSNADSIFSWIDGERTVQGDTATGAEILDKWVVAPVTNTVAIESIKEYNPQTKRNQTWWHAPGAINVFSNAKYGTHCENGGAIFYTTYYELMSRLRYGKTDSAMQRMIAIAREYGKDELKRDPINDYGSAWILGIIGEFPESGLVPTVFIKGFMGVNAAADGLHILPQIPDEYSEMGAKNVYYSNKTWDVEIEKGKRITLTATDENESSFALIFGNFAQKEEYVVRVGEQTVSAQKRPDGAFSAQITVQGKNIVTVEPVGE